MEKDLEILKDLENIYMFDYSEIDEDDFVLRVFTTHGQKDLYVGDVPFHDALKKLYGTDILNGFEYANRSYINKKYVVGFTAQEEPVGFEEFSAIYVKLDQGMYYKFIGFIQTAKAEEELARLNKLFDVKEQDNNEEKE